MPQVQKSSTQQGYLGEVEGLAGEVCDDLLGMSLPLGRSVMAKVYYREAHVTGIEVKSVYMTRNGEGRSNDLDGLALDGSKAGA